MGQLCSPQICLYVIFGILFTGLETLVGAGNIRHSKCLATTCFLGDDMFVPDLIGFLDLLDKNGILL